MLRAGVVILNVCVPSFVGKLTGIFFPLAQLAELNIEGQTKNIFSFKNENAYMAFLFEVTATVVTSSRILLSNFLEVERIPISSVWRQCWTCVSPKNPAFGSICSSLPQYFLDVPKYINRRFSKDRCRSFRDGFQNFYCPTAEVCTVLRKYFGTYTRKTLTS